MSLLSGEILGLHLPRLDKRCLVIAETDECTVDGDIAATGCNVGVALFSSLILERLPLHLLIPTLVIR
jgi:formylmethanofuran dehydrogenase subunit E